MSLPTRGGQRHPVLGGKMTYADDLDAPIEEEEFDEDDLDTDDEFDLDGDDEYDFDDEDDLDEDDLDDDTDDGKPGS
jgi:hypothetical protein